MQNYIFLVKLSRTMLCIDSLQTFLFFAGVSQLKWNYLSTRAISKVPDDHVRAASFSAVRRLTAPWRQCANPGFHTANP